MFEAHSLSFGRAYKDGRARRVIAFGSGRRSTRQGSSLSFFPLWDFEKSAIGRTPCADQAGNERFIALLPFLSFCARASERSEARSPSFLSSSSQMMRRSRFATPELTVCPLFTAEKNGRDGAFPLCLFFPPLSLLFFFFPPSAARRVRRAPRSTARGPLVVAAMGRKGVKEVPSSSSPLPSPFPMRFYALRHGRSMKGDRRNWRGSRMARTEEKEPFCPLPSFFSPDVGAKP